MKKVIVVLLLSTSIAQAQIPTANDRWKGVVASCIGENIELASKIDQLNQQIKTLTEALEKQKPKPEVK